MRRCLLVPVICGTALAQSETTISGKIADAITHQPIAGARVEYCCFPNRVFVVSAADGEYLLKVVQDDVGGALTVAKTGYGKIETPRQKFSAKQTRDVELLPAAHIIGRLVDRDTDQPLAGFTVTARPAKDSNGPFSFGPATGADGSFAIGADLNHGDYLLEIQPPSRNRIVAGGLKPGEADTTTYGYGLAWYPGVPREDMAAPVTVSAGEKREVEIRLRKRATPHHGHDSAPAGP